MIVTQRPQLVTPSLASTAFFTHVPRKPLADFVELFWYAHGNMSHHLKERRLPTGKFEIVINLRDDRLCTYEQQDNHHFQSHRGSVICGVHSKHFIIDTAQQASIIGVLFKPGGAFPFLNLPADELQNVHASLYSVWGTKADELRDRLLEAKTPEMKFSILERSMLHYASLPLARNPAVTFALEVFKCAPQLQSVSEVISRTGLSHRRFIEVFSQDVGVTPKMFCRILRFQKALQLTNGKQTVDWPDIAFACGYFDQAHFIRNFKEFSGVTPSRYLTCRGEPLNHVPLVE